MTGGPRDKDETEGERFIDLVDDDTKRIDRGPVRVGPPTRPGDTTGPTQPVAPRKPPRFRWPDPEERLEAAGEGVSNAQLLGLRRGEPEPEERIDLHGLRRDAAGTQLARRIEAARSRGLRCVLVIHGRGHHSPAGEAVLRTALPDWLTRDATAHHVLAFAPAPGRLGGDGAAIVLLRRSR